MLNEYDLERFKEIEEQDLDDLEITVSEDRAKILTAAELLQDYEGKNIVQNKRKTQKTHLPVMTTVIKIPGVGEEYIPTTF